MIQYTEASQTSPLTMAELGQLAADITCAIKTNMPNAVVAINHSTWNSNEETNSYWTEMKRAPYDLVWTTGVGNNGNFIESAGKAGYYNATTATYPYIHQYTGKNIVVDTSYGASAMSDSWSNQTKAALDVHIGNGVIGVNIAKQSPVELPDHRPGPAARVDLPVEPRHSSVVVGRGTSRRSSTGSTARPQQRRREDAADDDGGQRPLHLGAGAASRSPSGGSRSPRPARW